MRILESPTWEWDFGTRKRLHPSMTFSRASAAYFWDDAENLVKRCEINEPSFLDSGILIHSNPTNRCLQNRNFAEAVWVKSNTETTQSAMTGVDGTEVYAGLVALSSGGTCLQTISPTTASLWQFSFFVKRIMGVGKLFATIDGGTNWTEVSVTEDFTRFVMRKTDATATSITVGFKIEDTDSLFIIDMAEAATVGTAANNAFTNTRPIPTTSSTATTSVDILVMDFDKAGFNPLEGTIVVEGTYGTQQRPIGMSPRSTQHIIQLASTTSAYIAIGNTGTTFSKPGLRVDDTTNQVRLETGGGGHWANNPIYTTHPTRRVAIAWAANDFAIIDDGVESPQTDLSGTVPSITGIGIGGYPGTSASNWGGTIRFLKYYNKRLSNTQLKDLTRIGKEI